MSEIATINIDKKTIESIVNAQMQAAIVGQLGAVQDQLLAKMVDGLLNTRVKDNGELTTDSYYKTSLLEHLARNKIKDMAKNAIDKFFESQAPDIEKKVLAEITKQKGNLAKAAVSAITKSFTSDFRYNVKIEVAESK